jgi:hypothetical protein
LSSSRKAIGTPDQPRTIFYLILYNFDVEALASMVASLVTLATGISSLFAIK